MSIVLYITVMALVTYIVRKSRFLKSFLFYIPYAILSAMTIPAIFYSTGSVITAAVGTVIAVVLAYYELPLIVVALAASAGAFAAGFFI